MFLLIIFIDIDINRSNETVFYICTYLCFYDVPQFFGFNSHTFLSYVIVFFFLFFSVLCMLKVNSIMTSAADYTFVTDPDIGFYAARLAMVLSAISVILMAGYKASIDAHE